jgi:hypothetical protein
MMHLKFLYLTLCLTPLLGLSQGITQQFGLGGSESESPIGLSFGPDGSLFLLSTSRSPNSGSIDINDVPQIEAYFHLTKLLPDFSVVWQKGYGGNGSDGPSSILAVQDGFILGGSTTSAQNTGNKTAPVYGQSDYWLLKINYDGEIIWQQTYGGSNGQSLRSIISLGNNEYLLSGSSRSNASGVKTENSYGGSDYWLIKINGQGDIIWDKTIGSSGDENLINSILLPNNTILVCGTSTGLTASGLKTEPNNSVLEDIWLVCLDLNGNILWDRVLGGVHFEEYGTVTASNEAIYALIDSWSDVSGQRTAPRKGGRDVWVVKLDFDGTLLWDKAFGGSGVELVRDAFWDNDRIFVASASSSNISFDKTEDSKGGFDYWPFTLTLDGDVIEDITLGGDQNDEARKIVKHHDKVYILGASDSGISGDKTSINHGWDDIWLVEIDAATLKVPAHFAPERIAVYPNPFTSEIHVNFEELHVHRIELTDNTGKLIQSFEINHSNTSSIVIETGELPNGTYHVRLISKHGIYSKKVVCLR